MRAGAHFATPLVFAILAGGCQVEALFPEKVGAGAGRLTVRNAAYLLSITDGNAECGFKSPDVVAGYEQDGEVGQMGSVTWRVEDCTIDLGWEPQVIGADCTGAETSASGRIIVSGTRRVEGILTGNPETPVIPQSADAVAINLHAVVFGYRVKPAGAVESALIKQGVVDVSARVHLAQSESLGVCAIPTDEITLESIVVSDAIYEIDSGDRIFDVPVPSAEISAQVGAWGDRENAIGGSIKVWDDTISLDEDPVLDAHYDADAFRDSYACVEDLKLPVDYTCEPLGPRLADGAAKLTIHTVGNIVSAFSKNTQCGFQSAAVKASPTITGEVGRAGGVVTYRIDEACALDFGAGFSPPAGCSGESPTLFGKARFTGTLEIRGRLTGDPAQPVIPGARDPVTLTFHLDLENAKVQGANPEVMEVVRGSVTGTMRPRMAIDTVTGACSIDTPVVSFEDIAWGPDTDAIIRTEGNALGIAIGGSSLNAQNGNKDGVENRLVGEITVGGETYAIPLEGQPPTLDPSYDRDAFMASWTCEENLRVPTSDEDCSMRQVIGDGVARLVIQTVGTVAGAVNMDANCGYSNKMDVLKNPTQVQGNAGQMGSLSWAIQDCGLGPGDVEATYQTDCAGGVTKWKGNANVDSSRTVRGMREDIEVFLLGRVADSIAPMSPESVDLWLTSVQLTEFHTYALGQGQEEPLGILTIHSGTLDAFVKPITGWDEAQARYVIPTPVATIQGVRLRNATATLRSQGMTFEITIEDTNLQAVNGEASGQENHIQGTVTVDGAVVNISGDLNPEYDPAALAASWACNTAPEQGACSQAGRSTTLLGALSLIVALRFRKRR